MLCHGERLRTFEISVGELLDRSEKSHHALALKTDAGHRLFARYRRTQNSEDLEQSIKHFERASDLCTMDHPYRPAALFNLATAKFVSCQADGRYLDVDIPISLFQGALDSRPTDHPDRSIAQLHLAIALLSRIDVDDLEQERPVPSLLPLSPDQLADRAELCLQRDEPGALDEVISLHYDALRYYNTGHACQGQLLGNLSAMLGSRFKRRGNDRDLDEAIALYREILALHPVGHTERSKALNNLANELSSRFHHRWNEEDLDQAIALHREALALHPVGHTDRSVLLNNLANGLSSRFDHRENEEDLDEAIALHREALALCPVGHTDRSISLNNLANKLSFRFNHRENEEDLDRSASLNNLANGLSSRFDHRGNEEDLHEAIALNREALALRPVGHTDRSMSLNNLANALSSRFDHQGNDEDLNESRENLQLGGAGVGGNTDSLNAAMHHIKAAASVVSGGLLSRLRASIRWVRHASQHSHDTQLEAYVTSMQLLDAYMPVTASVSSRHTVITEFPSTLAMDAASCALRSDDVGRAVELLEQGRTIIWTQMARLRTPLDSLQTCGDHALTLMKRFRELSSLLDKPPASHSEGTRRIYAEAEETWYRRLVKDWNGTVEEIRKIEGFSRFLLPPLFSDLQDAARDGPIIVLIASRSSCDAIIIPHKQPPTSIQLPTNLQKLAELVIAFREAVPKDAGPKGNQRALMEALRELWGVVVRPVVENLGAIARQGSRIWWCPTSLFNFLPLHAAGEYRKDGGSVSRHYISSYTPSLTALIKARASQHRSPSVPFVAIGQNHPAIVSFTLDAVEPELELVRKLMPAPPTVSFSKITSVDATKSTALSALQENTWFHLACHGTQKFDEPFKSAFLMRDQPLSLLDIAQMDLSRHQFAFLSACETALGTFSTPDEVIHLAAGLQFAGVKSVVGTLWKVDDNTVQRLVEAFYTNLCGDGTMNSKRAARALHRAVQSLASDKDMLLAQRIVFVHIGISLIPHGHAELVAKDFDISDFETVYLYDM
ncbi:CHAT domain-containing protein [Suillus variegatus]|nr:CHAT domain-containing protein [Suillus variegatus]